MRILFIRRAQVDSMTEMTALLERLSRAGLPLTDEIRQAMLSVDIQDFSNADPRTFWHDHPLVFLRTEAGGVKTISAPHMVVTMLGHLELHAGHDVLVLGAKGGYMAALIAHIVGDSGSVTVVDPSRQVVDHVRTRLARNGGGGPIKVRKLIRLESAPPHLPLPLQRVLVTGSLRELPEWIDSRLDDGGFAIAPLGNRNGQRLVKRERQGEQRLDTDLGGVIFGPVDIAETESMGSNIDALADMFDEGAAIAEEIGALEVEDRMRLRRLANAIRDLPDDLPPLRPAAKDHERVDEEADEGEPEQAEEGGEAGEEDSYIIEMAFSAVAGDDLMENADHPLLDLLWAEMHWLGPIIAVLESLLDLRLQHPGDPEQPTARFDEGGFGSHGDLVP